MSRIIDISRHRRWGDSIYFLDYKKRKVTGHMTPKPKVGDKIICEMESPNPDTSRHFKIFNVTKVKPCFDPADQFFADVIDSGFIIRADEKEIKFELGSKCPLCRKRFKKDFWKMAKHMQDKHLKEVSV